MENEKSIKAHIPNILTLYRIVSIPFFIYFTLTSYKYGHFFSLFIFVFAAISDYYDGYFARKYKVASNFGKLLDPIADKCLVIGALIMLNIEPFGYIPVIVTVLITFRELAITWLRRIYLKKRIIIPADYFGKLKTTLQLIGIIACLTWRSLAKIFEPYSYYPYVVEKIQPQIFFYLVIFFWILVAVTLLSGLKIYIDSRKL